MRLLLAALLIGGITGCAASYPTVNLQLQRDPQVEARAAGRHREIVAELAPSARTRLQLAGRSFIGRFVECPDGGDIAAIARQEVERAFERATGHQVELLALAVLAGSSADVRAGRGGPLDGLGEMDRLRLQLAMDRRSQFTSTLSNLLKKCADTSASIVQNLK